MKITSLWRRQQEKSDGRQSQLEEADHDKPLEKPLIKRDVFIPFMVILITDMAIFASRARCVGGEGNSLRAHQGEPYKKPLNSCI
ncbi:hypothetical protein SUGI_1025640 [Cryptomeria japonica]|nr:hypothetical protein SUGI_1025640 [Cryptomeria japonica]